MRGDTYTLFKEEVSVRPRGRVEPIEGRFVATASPPPLLLP
jgi:hypothetical protein